MPASQWIGARILLGHRLPAGILHFGGRSLPGSLRPSQDPAKEKKERESDEKGGQCRPEILLCSSVNHGLRTSSLGPLKSDRRPRTKTIVAALRALAPGLNARSSNSICRDRATIVRPAVRSLPVRRPRESRRRSSRRGEA